MTVLTAAVLLLFALLGFVAGCCYEGCRRGGTLDLLRDLDDERERHPALEREAAVRLARALGHPSAGPYVTAPRARPDLHVVRVAPFAHLPRQVGRG